MAARSAASTSRRREVRLPGGPAVASAVHLAASLRHHGFRGRLALSADHDEEVDELRATGADLVLRPFHLAAAPLLRQLTDHEG